MKAALLQITGTDDPAENIALLEPMLRQAAAEGAGFALTPEVSNCVSLSRARQEAVLRREAEDPMLDHMRGLAAKLGIWLSLGSLAVKTGDADGRFANRSFLIDPAGHIVARYDKIHMFDVKLGKGAVYAESKGFRPGAEAVLAETPFATLGLTVCYDLRFPALYRALAQHGAQVLLVPAAFAPETGVAHWEPLLRARAIECGAYVLAAAQTGRHKTREGRARATYGHTMAVSPWGEVLADVGTVPGIAFVDLDMAVVADARKRLPSLRHDVVFRGPERAGEGSA